MACNRDEELISIKTNFPSRCRIIDGTEKDEYYKSITIQPKDMDLTIKFKLADNYPDSVPDITVRSSSVSIDDTSDLIAALKIEAKALAGKPMLHTLVSSSETWLNERGLGRGTKTKQTTNSSHRKQKSKKNKDTEEDLGTKNASMKTAGDVIKRIQWDMDLPQDEFIVGYIDRFLGIQEKYFTAFSWEDIASVDYNVLAIPQHRIQYFKYKDLKVWDKNEKLDDVFGSLGGKSITDVIKNYIPVETKPEVGDAIVNNESQIDNEDSSDNDDIVVTLDSSTLNTSSYLSNLNKRPTHFIALKIGNPETVQRLVDVQTCIKSQKPQLESGFMPAACFHVTLCTLGLDTSEQIQKACDLLKFIQKDLCMLKPCESLKLTGVDNFYNRTVFAKIKYPKKFLEFVDYLKTSFVNAGIEIRDNYGFVPHITIAKISKHDSRQLGQKFLISDVYHDFKEAMLGSQSLDKLSLCVMGNDRGTDGFWVSLQDIELNA